MHSAFEHAADAIDQDYTAMEFWTKYLDFERDQQQANKAAPIIDGQVHFSRSLHFIVLNPANNKSFRLVKASQWTVLKAQVMGARPHPLMALLLPC